MSDVKWIKLATCMFDDEKMRLIEAMTGADSIIVIWVKLLTQAGRCNYKGRIMLTETVPYTEEMLSTVFARPIDAVRQALTIFEGFEMVDRQDGAIRIVNWEKHQNVDGMERVREQARTRMSASRARKKETDQDVTQQLRNGCVTVTQQVTQRYATDIDIDKEEDKEQGTPLVTLTSDIPQGEVSKATKKPETVTQVLDGWEAAPEVKSVMREFIAMRQRMRKPMTAYAVKLAIKKLGDLSGGDTGQMEAIINQSIERGWQGFFALADDGGRRDAKQKPQEVPANSPDFCDGLPVARYDQETGNTYLGGKLYMRNGVMVANEAEQRGGGSG